LKIPNLHLLRFTPTTLKNLGANDFSSIPLNLEKSGRR